MNFINLPKLKPGDKVAILSPSSDAASYFPWVVDQGLDRLKSVFGLNPVEYPTTRKRQPTPKERAKDLMAAFSDKGIKAIVATIGGSDQVKLLPYLDSSIIADNPKLFLGYSDNTNISQYLWNLGIPSYYGGAIMVQFAMPGPHMLKETIDTLRLALFDGGEYFLQPSHEYTDFELEWQDKDNLSKSRKFEENDGWYWDGSGKATGRLWGGCVESMLQYLSAGQPLPKFDTTDIVLFLETAENIPDHWVVDTLLTSLGEQKVLDRTTAVLMGRPKSWEFSKQLSDEERGEYKLAQRNTVISTIRKYRHDIPIVQNVDFGHTDPQVIVPVGNKAYVDSTNQTIKFVY